MARILFLDDMEERHRTFRPLAIGHDVTHVYSAFDAIRALNTSRFDQVFLDHDLSMEDILIEPGAKSNVPTGMTVVDHIVEMEKPPQDVIVHSCNEPAAIEMYRRLEAKKIPVRRISFPTLIRSMSAP